MAVAEGEGSEMGEAKGSTHYIAPLDGARCLPVAGRFRRRRLPVPFLPPTEEPGQRCFLCAPDQDAWDQGPWPDPDSALHLLGNAHPYGPLSLLVAPAGTVHHPSEPADLSDQDLERLCLAAWQPALDRFAGEGQRRGSFLNHGSPSGQTQRHLHAQVVGLAVAPLEPSAREAVEEDVDAAASEGRCLSLGGSGLDLVLPRHPSMTLEAWVVGFAKEATHPAAALRTLLAALGGHLTGNFNLVALEQPRLLRVVPRGISERAGLEFALPGRIDSVVACSLAESRQCWQDALAATEQDGP